MAWELSPRPMQYSLNTLSLGHGGSWPGANLHSFNVHRKKCKKKKIKLTLTV